MLQYFSDNTSIKSKFLLSVFFYNFHDPHGMSTFKTVALHLVSTIQLVKHLLMINEQLIQHSPSILWQDSQLALLIRPCPLIVSMASI